MLAILRLRPEAYGVSIQDEIEKRTGKRPATGSIYAALDRLEQKGFITAKRGAPTPERGGRAKLFFNLTAKGSTTLQASLRDLEELRDGVTIQGARA